MIVYEYQSGSISIEMGQLKDFKYIGPFLAYNENQQKWSQTYYTGDNKSF